MGHKEDVERFLAGAWAPVPEPARERAPWGLTALRGRLVELSGRGASAVVTAAFQLVCEAQRAEEPVAWVTLASGAFYPPDAADSGVDLAALVVVRVTDVRAALRASERLLRSGGFGLVIVDLDDPDLLDRYRYGNGAAGAAGAEPFLTLDAAKQGRLVSHAHAHEAAIACLTDKSETAPSLGSLVSLHASALRMHGPKLTVRALKDKQRGPGWTHESGPCRDPIGGPYVQTRTPEADEPAADADAPRERPKLRLV